MTSRSTAFSSLRFRRGFSLVEVIMALGIISFCLVALTGLLAVCLDASRESSSTTSDTLLFEKVVNQLRVVTVAPTFAQSGDKEKDQFDLPELGQEGGHTQFTVDAQNRYLASGLRKTSDAAKVVDVRVLNPSSLPSAGLEDPPALSDEGKVAFIQVTIRNVNVPESQEIPSSAVYTTELSLLTE